MLNELIKITLSGCYFDVIEIPINIIELKLD